MKGLIGLFLIFMITALPVSAQYYYKDILITKQTIEKWKIYKEISVRSVKLTSYESNGELTEGFSAKQAVARDFSEIITSTNSNLSVSTLLITYYDPNGILKKTVDTSDTYQSITEFTYDSAARLVSIINNSLETDNQVKETEEHIWKYDPAGKPATMLKIKNGSDTSFMRFILDEKGNVAEERSTHNKMELPVIYYYYDNQNRLTDIVKFNSKANRLLPEYIFEYDKDGRLASMLFVQEAVNEYQKWYYEYNEKGLKILDFCYDKRKTLLGKVQYEYSFAK